jgi:hypothetical protein
MNKTHHHNNPLSRALALWGHARGGFPAVRSGQNSGFRLAGWRPDCNPAFGY